jgi:hypothetical protein
VLAGIQEHDKLHLMLLAFVVVVEVPGYLLDHILDVNYLNVWPHVAINAGEVVTEDDGLNVKDLFFIAAKLIRLCKDQVKQDGSVSFVDHSIAKHSIRLVQPKSDYIDWLLSCFSISRADTLEDLGNVS